MNESGSILFVDDRIDTILAIRDSLHFSGYQVFTATTHDQAVQIVKHDSIQLAIIDLRLERDNDPKDTSGIKLAQEIDPFVLRKILLTGHPDAPIQDVTEASNPDANGHRLIDATLFKFTPDIADKLLNKVDQLFQQIPYNRHLIISSERGLTYRYLVDMIKGYRYRSETEKNRAEKIIIDMIHRTFDQATNLKLIRMDPGRGGCAVIRIQPYQGTLAWNQVVIKVGPMHSVLKEYKNYRDYVAVFFDVDRHTPQIKGEPIIYEELGMIKNSFLGGKIWDFGEYFDIHGAQIVCQALDDLFDDICREWYDRARPPETDDENIPLDQWYRKQLSLDDENHIFEARATLQELVSRKDNRFACFRLEGEDTLLVELDGRTHRLPNPVHYALEAGSKTIDPSIFPTPSLLAITHGDLNTTNLLIDEKNKKPWLIDFYHTGWGPILRDILELESAIKFELLKLRFPLDCYRMESELLSKSSLDETLQPINNHPRLVKAIQVIEHLRHRAYEESNGADIREYYIGLLFYALRQLTLSPSGKGNEIANYRRQHALISAALICEKLIRFDSPEEQALHPASPVTSRRLTRPVKPRQIFLAHEYRQPWKERIYIELKKFIDAEGYVVQHPLDQPPGGDLWDRLARMIRRCTLGFFEITTMNGNVCFELGFAMSCRRPYFALIKTDDVNRQNIPNILSGDWWIGYQSDNELHEKVRSILREPDHLEPWHYFQQPDFKKRLKENPPRTNLALLMTANTNRLRQDIAPILHQMLNQTYGFAVDELYIERQRELAKLHLTIVEHEVVLACFSSDDIENARYANAEIALATGIARGTIGKLIILQEQGCTALSDFKAITHEFLGKVEAAKLLQEQLDKLYPNRRQDLAPLASPRQENTSHE